MGAKGENSLYRVAIRVTVNGRSGGSIGEGDPVEAWKRGIVDGLTGDRIFERQDAARGRSAIYDGCLVQI